MVWSGISAADSEGVSIPPPVELSSVSPDPAHRPDLHATQHEKRRRTRRSLGRRVTVVTQVSSLVALTSTGALVGWMGQQAQQADALKAKAKAAAAQPVVVPVPVRRPVKTVVVRRTAAAVPQQATRPRTTTRVTSRTSTTKRTATTTTAPAPKPRQTTAPAATTTSGS
jgi:hypothetical protein